MAGPQHRTPEYRAARKQYDQAQVNGQWLWCVQDICMHPTRDIAPNQKVHVAHDDTGTVILGPAHEWCNAADGGRRRSRGPESASHLKWKWQDCSDCGSKCYGKRCADCWSRVRPKRAPRAPRAPIAKQCEDCGIPHARRSPVCSDCSVRRNRENNRNIYREREGKQLDGYRARFL